MIRINAFEHYTELDSFPMTGRYQTDFAVRAVDEPWIKKYFDGAPNCDQVRNITPGKTYKVHAVECFGDVSDFIFLDDNGEEARLGSFFFMKE